MRFIPISKVIPKERRGVASSASVLDADVTDPKKLSELLRQALRRISELEANKPAEAIEVELEVSSNTTYRIYHGLGTPVRWWATSWVPSSFFNPDCTFYIDTTVSFESDYISLVAVNGGKVVLRFESSPNQVTT